MIYTLKNLQNTAIRLVFLFLYGLNVKLAFEIATTATTFI
jgi:hypothetical protein